MRIAVVGGGISGLVAAYVLHRDHEVVLFESKPRLGGHTHTIDVEAGGERWAVDTGFVVYNETTYPNFCRLLSVLNVASRPTGMSFSVRCERTGLEYCGDSVNTLFAQRANLVRLSFLRLLAEIVRFNRRAVRGLAEGGIPGTLRDFLRGGDYSDDLVERYLVPMGAAIWSADPKKMLDFPADFFLRFLRKHRLLQIGNRLQWRTLVGGSRSYVDSVARRLGAAVRTSTPIVRVVDDDGGVELRTSQGSAGRFDHAIVATHSDQALRMLARPSAAVRETLAALPYQRNEAVLHTDTRWLPRNRRAWAAWNYIVPEAPQDRLITTYDMSRLQGLDSPEPFLVTLNHDGEIDPAKVIRQLSFAHPVYTADAPAAQSRNAELSHDARVHFCGAYWGNGFHEDGVNSALTVCERFGAGLP